MASGPHLGGLVLELGHPLRLPEAGQAAQHPVELRVFRNVGLQEHRGLCGIDASGQQLRRTAQRPLPKHLRWRRDGQRMQIGDPVERLMIILQRHPLAQRTEKIAEVHRIRGRLGEREYAGPASTAV